MMNPTTPQKRVTVSVNADLDLQFRKLASQTYKFEKGWYSKAMAEAMAMWMKNSELNILDDGITPMVRMEGFRLWETLKRNNNLNSNQELGPDSLDTICNVFTNESPFIDDIEYSFHDDNLLVNMDTSIITKNKDYFMMEDLIDKCSVPVIVLFRAGIEDITKEKYKIDYLKLGKSSQVQFKKVNSLKSSKQSIEIL